MATRDNLPIIRAARTGAVSAQLALGKRYFFGNSGLPQSTGTAFYWLERAARQGSADACLMIGRHVPYDVITTMPRPHEAAPWYERAFDAGVLGAGLVFARLVLEHTRRFGVASKHRALEVLQALAEQDDHDAQWLLAQHLQHDQASLVEQDLIRKAAGAGVIAAQYALLEQAWSAADLDSYRRTAMPLADQLLRLHKSALSEACSEPQQAPTIVLDAQETGLLMRLAQVSPLLERAASEKTQNLLALAAIAGVAQARYQLGLLHASLSEDGQRMYPLHGVANYRKAVAWLLLAANDGHTPAWHALSRVYARSEFAHRDLPTARRYLERAAQCGLVAAQFECAQHTWRNRRDLPQGDIRALYWWMQAARQGHADASKALDEFAPRTAKGAWAHDIVELLTARTRKANPFLCARLELAGAFGLSRPEALLLDIPRADHGHCLEIDIGAFHARSRRRLVLIEDGDQRALVRVAARLFGDVDCGADGPEGNYRQRQYRLAGLVDSLHLPGKNNTSPAISAPAPK